MSQPPYPQQPDSGSQQPGYQNPGGQQQGYQNPGYQNPGYQNPGYQNPGYQNPGNQQPGYQNPGNQQPGYQNAPPPPSGYGAGGGMPPQQALSRPTTVTYAIYALIANIVLGLITSVLIFANKDAYLDQAFRDAGLDPSSSAAASVSNAAFTIGAIIGLVFVALFAMFVWFAWKGHNWARIVIWVLSGLSLIGVFNAFSSPLGVVVVVNVVSLLLTVAAIVLLALKPSNEWYRYQGEARKYGWPGRA